MIHEGLVTMARRTPRQLWLWPLGLTCRIALTATRRCPNAVARALLWLDRRCQ